MKQGQLTLERGQDMILSALNGKNLPNPYTGTLARVLNIHPDLDTTSISAFSADVREVLVRFAQLYIWDHRDVFGGGMNWEDDYAEVYGWVAYTLCMVDDRVEPNFELMYDCGFECGGNCF